MQAPSLILTYMAKQFIVKESYKGCVIATRKPEHRKSGVFNLSRCSQRDLKFLHQVIRHPAVKQVEYAEEK